MKRMVLMLMALLLVVSAAAAEQVDYFNTDLRDHTDVYYINPQGGQRYHMVAACPAISQKYHAGMVAVTVAELKSAYSHLKPCTVCDGEMPTPAEATEYGLALDGPGEWSVGVDIPAGMYGIKAGSYDIIRVRNWADKVIREERVDKDEIAVLTLYNEQTLCIPKGYQATYYMQLGGSAYDTGSRGVVTEGPGVFDAGDLLMPGLYIVQNESTHFADVTIRQKATGEVLRSWRLQPDSHYTILLEDGCTLQIGEGCLLRSATTEWLFQEGTSATIPQSRYSTRLQIPMRRYTVSGRDDTSLVQVTALDTKAVMTYPLGRNGSVVLDMEGDQADELLIEFVNVDVRWEQGEG